MMVPRLRSEPIAAASTPGKSLAIGSRVARRYCVAAHLHSDGAGHAYVAVDERPSSARRLVVLETLPGEPRPSSGAVEAFVRDGRLRERMHHPNVVQTDELVQHDGLPVLVTEYLEGESLATLLALAYGMPDFSLEVRLTILAHAVRGLAYIHQLGAAGPSRLVHANVSPHDIVITYDGAVKLSGFGSAAGGARRFASAALAPADLEYLAPERLHASIQPASDVFSAGILLWELVALQRFWNQLPQYEVRRRLVAFDIPDIARLKPHVGGELARICRQALAADPAQRYPSAAPLAVELERFLVERSAVASPAALALVMKKACCALQREARERLSTALDAVQGGAQRRSEAPSEVGIWHVLTKERPMSSSKAAWVAGALGVLTIAVAAQIARTQASSASDAQPVAIEPITLEAASPEAVLPSSGSLQAASLQAMPLPDPAGEGMAASPPERRSPSTTIQTLMPERPRPSPASVASRAKLERVEAVLERRRLAEPEPRARRARRLPESTPSPSLDEAAPPSREAPTLTIRLER
jgi:eukaryotic-like serine/threonine-protein kinase